MIASVSEHAPPRAPFSLDREQTVPGTVEEVFAFFSDPKNLEAITPPWLRFRVLRSSTPELGEGTLIDYRLRLRGIPLRWRSRIAAWNPPHDFVDEQVIGPYRAWIHRHTFQPTPGGVLVRDHVDYGVPGGWLVERLLVRRDLERIFDHRRTSLAALFEPS